jgi:hypothetical protein
MSKSVTVEPEMLDRLAAMLEDYETLKNQKEEMIPPSFVVGSICPGCNEDVDLCLCWPEEDYEDASVNCFEEIMSSAIEGKYTTKLQKPYLRHELHITVPAQSIEWNKELNEKYNTETFPKLQEEYTKDIERLQKGFRADLIEAFMSIPDISRKRAEKLFELAYEDGLAVFNRQDFAYKNPESIIVAYADSVYADIFRDNI